MIKSLARVQVLILDDWGLTPLTAEHRRDLLEITDDRHQRASTIVTSQLPVDKWHAHIGDRLSETPSSIASFTLLIASSSKASRCANSAP